MTAEIGADGELTQDYSAFALFDSSLRQIYADSLVQVELCEAEEVEKRKGVMNSWEKRDPLGDLAKEYVRIGSIVFCTNPLLNIEGEDEERQLAIAYLGLTEKGFYKFELFVKYKYPFEKERVEKFVSSPFVNESPLYLDSEAYASSNHAQQLHSILRGESNVYNAASLDCVMIGEEAEVAILEQGRYIKIQAEHIDLETAKQMYLDIHNRVDGQLRKKLEANRELMERSLETQQFLEELRGKPEEEPPKKKRGLFGRSR